MTKINNNKIYSKYKNIFKKNYIYIYIMLLSHNYLLITIKKKKIHLDNINQIKFLILYNLKENIDWFYIYLLIMNIVYKKNFKKL